MSEIDPELLHEAMCFVYAQPDGVAVSSVEGGEIVARAIHQDRQRSAWQPIETAPKDGTAVDLWAYRGQLGALGLREGERYADCRFCRSNYGTEPYGDPRWQGLNDRYIEVTPTHWMPIPGAPEAE